MKRNYVYSYFFVATVVCLLLSFSVIKQSLFNILPVSKDRSVTEINRRINNIIISVEEQHKTIKAKLTVQGPDFNWFVGNEFYPTVVFQRSEIKLWNSFKFMPQYGWCSGNFKYKLLKTPTGKFLLIKSVFKENFEIVSFLPLNYNFQVKNVHLKNSSNPALFGDEPILINEGENAKPILSPEGENLFSIEFANDNNTSEFRIYLSLLIQLLALIFFVSGIYLWFKNSKQSTDWKILILLVFIVVFRLIVLFINSNYLAANPIDLGSLLKLLIFPEKLIQFTWNSLALLIFLVFIILNINSSLLYRNTLLNSLKYKNLYLPLCIVINQLLSFGLYQSYYKIFQLDIFNLSTLFVNPFSFQIFLSLFSIFNLTVSYFIISHISARLVLPISPDKHAKTWFLAAVSNFLFVIILYISGTPPHILISSFSFLLIFILVKLELPLTLTRIRYVTYIYIITIIIYCSFVASLSFNEKKQSEIIARTERIAHKINREGGQIDYERLVLIKTKIQSDNFIVEGINNPIYDRAFIEQKIRKIYLEDKFDQFETNIYLFDPEGNCINKSIKGNYFSYFYLYNKPKFKTPFPDIFSIKELSPVYYNFIALTGNKNRIRGYIILEFKLRKVVPNSVFPELLSDKNILFETSDYNYAIYKNNKLVSSFGNFNYFKEFKELNGEEYKKLCSGYDYLEKFHIIFNFSPEKDILISVNSYAFKYAYAVFCFLFLFHVIIFSLFIFSNTFYYKFRQVSSTFTTKIQLLINFAFFIPLVVMGITIFSAISYSFQADLQLSFIKKAETISNNLVNVLDSYKKKKIEESNIEEELVKIGKYVESDINLYNTSGRLIATTQPRIFEASLLSTFINPNAYADLIEKRETFNLLPESIGDLNYNTVYYAINSYEQGEVLGILAVPYFGSRKDLSIKIGNVLVSIINIFTTVFILFLIISYFASRILTIPLTLLTNKIKEITLANLNQPLIYEANDEIGILVKEYNKMLVKLEESKTKLAVSEKEAAWREMARQVAHEIKNPLTPMKLTLQNLKRLLQRKESNLDELLTRSVDSLLEQTDNLSDIATSFSTFTQMPVPKKELFNISSLTQKIIHLFMGKEDVVIDYQIEEELFIKGDEKLMGRILINLLTNALESVPKNIAPNILFNLHKEDNWVLITLKDNGSGIPEHLHQKVFQPNFSTKTSGLGIGLAVAKRGIEQMEGTIWFKSMETDGTTFFIKLPHAINEEV